MEITIYKFEAISIRDEQNKLELFKNISPPPNKVQRSMSN